jgi:urate oxidase
MGIVLGANSYGKAESRVVRIVRDTDRHQIRDLNVSTALRGDFVDVHTRGDNRQVLPTDTQRNTAFAWAKKHGVDSPEDYALALGRRLLEATPAATGVTVDVEEYAWDRLGDHAFVRRGTEVRTVRVDLDEAGAVVRSGLTDLVLLKSTDSEFRGFLHDDYTTLEDADDRVLATSLTASWTGETGETGETGGWDASYDAVRALLLDAFAAHHSHSLQETLYAMGRAVLEERAALTEIAFTAPNRHHHLADLAPFGIENAGEVFVAADRPYGLIQVTVTRDDG